MHKDDYLPTIAEKCGVSKSLCDKVIDAFLDELSTTLVKKDKVIVTNLGSFTKTKIEPKQIFSPIDGSTLKATSYYRITFTCSKKLLEKLKK